MKNQYILRFDTNNLLPKTVDLYDKYSSPQSNIQQPDQTYALRHFAALEKLTMALNYTNTYTHVTQKMSLH